MTAPFKHFIAFGFPWLLSPWFYARQGHEQASNPLLRTRTALRLDLANRFLLTLQKLQVKERPNGWTLTINTSSRERAIALAIEICVVQACWRRFLRKTQFSLRRNNVRFLHGTATFTNKPSNQHADYMVRLCP